MLRLREHQFLKTWGIFMDEMINWKPHISSLIRKNSNFNGAIYRKCSLISYVCHRNLYFALIHSRLIYGSEVFGSAPHFLRS